MSPGEDGEVAAGGRQSTELMSGGLISSTRSTTGDEVFFRLATASPRVTPVSSMPFTFNRMSPGETRATAESHFGGS